MGQARGIFGGVAGGNPDRPFSPLNPNRLLKKPCFLRAVKKINVADQALANIIMYTKIVFQHPVRIRTGNAKSSNAGFRIL